MMKEIESLKELDLMLKKENKEISYYAFQSLDLYSYEDELKQKNITNCIFMGCKVSSKFSQSLMESNNLFFPVMDVPFKTYPAVLYTKDTMYNNFDPANPASYNLTYDKITYDYYVNTGKYSPESIYESLARRLHDHSITDALMDIIDNVDPKKVVAIMGGHGLSRSSTDYFRIAQIAKLLSEKNFFLLSGGGPGAMEATHLGAYFDGYSVEEMKEGIELLAQAPKFNDELWLSKSFEVMDKFPSRNKKGNDIGIPTWLYGHEPPTPFASKIAKYFANSVREEGLLALAKGGVIYTPGSAGTIQEIFQDATQNHYNSYNIISPMIFYNKNFWINEKPVYPLLSKLAEGYEYKNHLSISDDIDDIVETLIKFSNS